MREGGADPTRTTSARRRRYLRWLGLGLAATLALTLAAWGLAAAFLTRLARQREQAVLRDWAASGETAEQFLARFPPTGDNAAAIELEQLAAAVGVDLAPRNGRRRWDVVPGYPLQELEQTLVADNLAPHAPLEIPPVVASWMRDQETPFDAIVDCLESSEPPEWGRSALSRLWTSDKVMPNLRGSLLLHKALIVRAMSDAEEGRTDRVGAGLDAAWVLACANLRRHEVISVLIGMAQVRATCAALRRIPSVSAGWDARLADINLLDAMSAALRVEVWMGLELSQEPSPAEAFWRSDAITVTHVDDDLRRGTPWSRRARLEALARRPWIRLSVVTGAQLAQRMHDDWRRGDPCTMDPAVVAERARLGLADDDLGMFVVSNLSQAWALMRRSEIDIALTREVLRLRRDRIVGAPLPLACASWYIDREVLPDGGVRATFHGTLPWTIASPRPEPPLEHVGP